MKLTCQQCGYANEVERIYCHNCGTKLDRSSVPAEDPNKKKKVRKGPPLSAVVGRHIFHGFLTVLLAALAAAIWCVFKPVEAPGAKNEEAGMLASDLSLELEALASSATPGARAYSQSQVNSFLKERTKLRKNDAGNLKLAGSWVQLAPNRATLTVRYSLFGLPIGYEEVWEIQPAIPAKPKLIGAKLGRLRLPAAAAAPVTGEFSKIFWKRLDHEGKLLKNLGAKIEKEGVTIFSGPPTG